MNCKVSFKNLDFISCLMDGYISKAGHNVIVYHPHRNLKKL